MAVAEARAVWQRTANRCFVQEDAKRAPKLACCPSTSSSAKQVEAGPASATDGHDNFAPGFAPRDTNPSYSNLSPDSRWWLQLQPNHAYQRGLTNEQTNTSETEMKAFTASKLSGVQRQTEVDVSWIAHTQISDPLIDTFSRISATSIKKDFGVTIYSKDPQEMLKIDSGEESYEFVEMDSVGCTISKELDEFSLDLELSSMWGEKSEPWWRMADRDELASFVAKRSLDLVENCDLPQPQNTNYKRDPYAHSGCLDGDGIFTSFKDWKPQIIGCLNPTVHTMCNAISGSACGKNWAESGTCKPIGDGKIHKGVSEMPIPETDPSKARLLEALRHSQTRAREAEKAAKEAYAEKEHIVKLLFKQASHLFAYKQWFRLLQLENLYFQIMNNKSQPITSLFPVDLPRVPRKTRKKQKNWQKPKKRVKRGLPIYEYDIGKYAVVFAVGLSLVGAGLLLGWTVGWMLPAL